MYKVHYFFKDKRGWVFDWRERFCSETDAAEAIAVYVKIGSVTEYKILPAEEECW